MPSESLLPSLAATSRDAMRACLVTLCVRTQLKEYSLDLGVKEACTSLVSGVVREVHTEEDSGLVTLCASCSDRDRFHRELLGLSVRGVTIQEVHFEQSGDDGDDE